MASLLVHLRKYLLLYILAPLILALGVVSYYRFIVAHDYLVSYEGACEPMEEDCYTGCEDEECTGIYYYTIVEKYAADLYAQCGPDITDCEAANTCQPEETFCTVTHCDIELEGELCESLVGVPALSEEDELEDAVDGEEEIEVEESSGAEVEAEELSLI